MRRSDEKELDLTERLKYQRGLDLSRITKEIVLYDNGYTTSQADPTPWHLSELKNSVCNIKGRRDAHVYYKRGQTSSLLSYSDVAKSEARRITSCLAPDGVRANRRRGTLVVGYLISGAVFCELCLLNSESFSL